MTIPANPRPPRHRAPLTPLGRAGMRMGAGALVIAAIAAGGVIKTLNPEVDQRERPFAAGGARDETVATRGLDITVIDVRGGKQISRSGKLRKSEGVWVLVKVRATALDEPRTVGYAALRDSRGRLYNATDRITQTMIGGRTFQPAISIEGEIVFEVPQDAASGLTLLLAPNSLDQRMDWMLEVPIPVSTSTVDTWIATSETIPIKEEVVVT